MEVYEISKWAQDLVQDEVVLAELERSCECVELLTKIMALNKEADKDVNEMIKTDNYLADFYTKKSDEISEILNSLVIKDLSLSVQNCVKNISSIALLMKLKEPTLTNFLLSSSFLENKLEEYAESQLVDCFNLSKLSKKTAEIILRNIVIERKLEASKKIVSKQCDPKVAAMKSSEFLKKKIENYDIQIKKQESKLESFEWTPSLRHNELVKKGEEIQRLEKELETITAKLNSYQNLPPNETLAALKVEEAQAKLLHFQKIFQSLL